LTEQRLLQAILDGEFPPGSTLPGERELSGQLGITRPTLRQVLHQLARDGWLDIQHGKPTRVRDYWREGNMNVLSALVRHSKRLPDDFVPNLLAVRLCLAPAYARAAVAQASDDVIALLADNVKLEDTAESFARADWKLHQGLTLASGNPIFTLILNGFADFYAQMAQLYFSQPQARNASRAWYGNLLAAACDRDADAAEEETRRAMQESIEFWPSGEMHPTDGHEQETTYATMEWMGRR
jgi:GntR family negative regulator for fad regulon and positive regulator of fabA